MTTFVEICFTVGLLFLVSLVVYAATAEPVRRRPNRDEKPGHLGRVE